MATKAPGRRSIFPRWLRISGLIPTSSMRYQLVRKRTLLIYVSEGMPRSRVVVLGDETAAQIVGSTGGGRAVFAQRCGRWWKVLVKDRRRTLQRDPHGPLDVRAQTLRELA